MENMKILFGGSFNPPTIAHYNICKYLLDLYPNSEIIFLPTSKKYPKKELVDDNDRLAMLDIMVKKLGERTSVSKYEIEKKDFLGTYYTLKNFKDCYFLIGADKFFILDKWIKYKELISENKFIIIPRENFDIEKKFQENDFLEKFRDNFIVLDKFEINNVSSSLYKNSKNQQLLLEEVLQYAQKRKLYE